MYSLPANGHIRPTRFCTGPGGSPAKEKLPGCRHHPKGPPETTFRSLEYFQSQAAEEHRENADCREAGRDRPGTTVARWLVDLTGRRDRRGKRVDRSRLAGRQESRPDILEPSTQQGVSAEAGQGFFSARETQGTILLAEDDPLNRKLILLQIDSLGYRAEAVTNGREAVEAVLSGDYVLILMDLRMPVLDGLEAMKAIRGAQSGPKRHTPIIALTAQALQEDCDQCISAGADDYLTKPISRKELELALARWLSPPGPGKDFWRPVALPEQDDEVIDARIVAELRALQGDGLPDILGEVSDIFTAGTPSRLAVLRRAAAEGDARSLQETAHGLKSSSASVGAVALSGLAGQLEALGKKGTTDGAASLVARTEAEYEKAKKALRAALWRGEE